MVDKYKTGVVWGHPIISLEEFLKRPDCKEYLLIVTAGKENIRNEIKAELESYGLNCIFGYPDLLFFDQDYFDLPYLDLQDEFFVDAGALDGDSTISMFKFCKEGSHSYVIEPSPEQFAHTQECLKNYPNVEYFQCGLYDENTTLHFDATDTTGAARVTEDGNITIEARKLDDLLQSKKVTFIKMDIEGSELAALRGAEQIIREQRPKLAICVYHKLEDIWEIPSLILSYCPEYKLYLRHYSMSDIETVLYAIP